MASGSLGFSSLWLVEHGWIGGNIHRKTQKKHRTTMKKTVDSPPNQSSEWCSGCQLGWQLRIDNSIVNKVNKLSGVLHGTRLI
jgi:hypothetical protein